MSKRDAEPTRPYWTRYVGELEDPWWRWRQYLGFLYLPAILVLIAGEWFFGATPTLMFLTFVGFSVAYAGIELIAYRKP